MTKQNLKSFAVGFACSVVALAQGCGPSAPETASHPVQKMAAAAAPASTVVVPAGTSVAKINSLIVGNYQYLRSGCRQADGVFVSQYFGEMPAETLAIEDSRLTFDDSYKSGCRVVLAFPLAGIDNQKIVLKEPSVAVSFQGMPDSDNQCAAAVPDLSRFKGKLVTFNYYFFGTALSLLGPPVGPCSSTELTEDVYSR